MKVLIACEFSGIVRDAFLRRGHDAWSCDILPTEKPGPHIQDDVLKHLDEGWDLMIAHPPCTHLASSGARWFEAKRGIRTLFAGEDVDIQTAAIRFFMALYNATVGRVAIENPVGIMSKRFRRPDQIIQPYQFGHPETKATCLWLRGLPPLVATNKVEPDYMRRKDGTYAIDKKGKRYSRVHFMSGRMKDKDRWRERSRTYLGIAEAMADQWGTL